MRRSVAVASAIASGAQSVASTRPPASAAAMLGRPTPQPSSSVRAPRSVRTATTRASASALGHNSAQYGRYSVLLERPLVKQRLAVAGAQHRQLAPASPTVSSRRPASRQPRMATSEPQDAVTASTSRAGRRLAVHRLARAVRQVTRAHLGTTEETVRRRPASSATAERRGAGAANRDRAERRTRGDRHHAPVLRARRAARQRASQSAGYTVVLVTSGTTARGRSRRCAPAPSTAAAVSVDPPAGAAELVILIETTRGAAVGAARRRGRHRRRDRRTCSASGTSGSAAWLRRAGAHLRAASRAERQLVGAPAGTVRAEFDLRGGRGRGDADRLGRHGVFLRRRHPRRRGLPRRARARPRSRGRLGRRLRRPRLRARARAPDTTVSADAERLGAIAFEALARDLAGDPPPAERVLGVALRVRESTGPPSR